MKSNKFGGILLLLIFVCVVTAIANENFANDFNAGNLTRYTAFFAIIGIGAAFVIITGGIDLSIGSVICVVGGTLTMSFNAWIKHPAEDNLQFAFYVVMADVLVLLAAWEFVPWLARRSKLLSRQLLAKCGMLALAVLAFAAGLFAPAIVERGAALGIDANWITFLCCALLSFLLAAHLGLFHGLLITKLNLQPFVVTLCGLMMYRGLTRWATDDSTQGFGSGYDDSFRQLAIGKTLFGIEITFGSLAMIGGLLLLVWCVFLAVQRLGQSPTRGSSVSGDESGDNSRLLLPLVCGSVAVIVGVAPMLAQRVGIEDAGEACRAVLLNGVWCVIPILLVLGWLYIRNAGSIIVGDRWFVFRVGLATLLLCSSAVALWWVKWKLGDNRVDVNQDGGLITLLRIAGATGLLIFSLFWLTRLGGRHLGPLGERLVVLAGFFGCLWLLGNTGLMSTLVPVPFLIMLVVLAFATVLLNQTVYGRHLIAVGRNETAARFSGIDTDSTKTMAYVLCGCCTGLGAILFSLDSNGVEPAGFGSFYELYAIAAAVLGGCLLRGGEGSIIGVLVGAAVLRVLNNAPDMIGVPQQLEFFIIGLIILMGAVADEVAKRLKASRQLKNVLRSQPAAHSDQTTSA